MDICPMDAILLVTITENEKNVISGLIMNNEEDEDTDAIIKIKESNSVIGNQLSDWINLKNVSENERTEKVGFVESYFENDLLAYELTEANFSEHSSLFTVDNSKLMIVRLFVKSISFIPSYATYQSAVGSGSNLNIWDYYYGENNCSKIREVRQKKYKQTLAHELLHLDYQ
jgi:hypothetical protein